MSITYVKFSISLSSLINI